MRAFLLAVLSGGLAAAACADGAKEPETPPARAEAEAPAAAAPPPALLEAVYRVATPHNSPVQAHVSKVGESWRVRYRIDPPAPALLFPRSAPEYGRRSWAPLTPGVRIERRGAFDVITGRGPISEASFAFTPVFDHIAKEYTPFVRFSNGATAVHTHQFQLLPIAHPADAERIDADSGAFDQPDAFLRVRFEDLAGRPVAAGGPSQDGGATWRGPDPGAYVLFGEAEAVESGAFTAA
ncbi:MAG: hypothetical protein MI723_07065, partial [Caulobacterales bacterium]|nr:hypothetical protein [Caulobacterales bacterium]